jgi:hypothetical protein
MVFLAIAHFVHFKLNSALDLTRLDLVATIFIIIQSTFLFTIYTINARKRRLLNTISAGEDSGNPIAKIPLLNMFDLGLLENIDSKVSYISYTLSICSDLAIFVFINIVLTIVLKNKEQN